MKFKLCGYPGCNKLTGKYYCEEHQKAADRRRRETAFASATRSSLYQSPLWRRLSRELIGEVGHCERCGCSDNLQTHHIIPVRLAPALALDRSNLQVLCRLCHQRETAKEIQTRKKH